MDSYNHVDVYDRAVKIKGQENVDRFSADPEKFLKEVGALDGIEEFNGIRSESEGEIDDLSSYFSRKRFFRVSGTIVVIIAHHGIPYEDYCSWHVQD